jgi:hypothetical protein
MSLFWQYSSAPMEDFTERYGRNWVFFTREHKLSVLCALSSSSIHRLHTSVIQHFVKKSSSVKELLLCQLKRK